MTKIPVTYVTSSDFKREENGIFVKSCRLPGGRSVDEVFEFQIRKVEMREPLEADLDLLVRAEVLAAYTQLRVPCVVEHAGLLFEGYFDRSYPGGLTKPMWNTLKGDFLTETQSARRPAIARAVVAYCDGMTIRTFAGESRGRLADGPHGDLHQFYWDTIFIPDDDNPDQLTYAEIVEQLGLEYKIVRQSQSSKAMLRFLEFRQLNRPQLWRRDN